MQLTIESIRAAVAKARVANVERDPVMVMHPLQYMLAVRGIHPFFLVITDGVKEMREQTWADYYWEGINGYGRP